jgi:hypothetical protein
MRCFGEVRSSIAPRVVMLLASRRGKFAEGQHPLRLACPRVANSGKPDSEASRGSIGMSNAVLLLELSIPFFCLCRH